MEVVPMQQFTPMKMMATSLVLLSLFQVPMGWAGNFGPNSGEAGAPKKEYMLEKEELLSQLNLTPQQKIQLKTLMDSRRQSSGDYQDIWRKRKDLMEMIHSGKGSKEQALSMHREIAQQQNASMEKRIAMIYEVRSILTPEQFDKFHSLMKERFHHGGHGHGGKHGGGMKRPTTP
jgi:Spy/CpxP family protein refolding chaperone